MKKPHYDVSIAFSDSFSLIKKQPRRVLIWGALLVLVPLLLILPVGIWALSSLSPDMTEPQSLWEMMTQGSVSNLFSLVQYLVAIPIVGAVVRFILDKPGPNRFAGLRLGMDELWVFVCYVAINLVGVLMLPVFAIVTILGGVLVVAGGESVIGIVVTVLFVIACAAALAWLSIRLSMLMPASIDLKTFALGPAWRASKGHVWPLLGTGILSALIMIGISILWFVMVAFLALLLSLIGAATGLVSSDDGSNFLGWVPLIIIGGVLMLVPTAFLSGMVVVLYTGPFASAWVQLRPRPLTAEPQAFERM